LLVLAGFAPSDNDDALAWMADKLIGLRVFGDAEGKMNLALADVHGAVLVVSQFTLYGDVQKGRRPSFIDAAPPELAVPLYERFGTRLACDKARTVAAREGGAVVLAADTTVVLRGGIFGKPATPKEAEAMLRRLAGRMHQVMTAVAVAQDGRVEHALDVTDVTFRRLTDEHIAAYVATGEPLDKAGAYAIQGKGAALVEGIRGDFFGVMG